jgi:hypothetical protein
VRYIDQQDDANFIYIAMTLCDETLEDRIQRKGLDQPAARLAACAKFCSGLAYLHELPSGSITHRDLKPSNLQALQGRLPQNRRHGPVPRAGARRDCRGDGLEWRDTGPPRSFDAWPWCAVAGFKGAPWRSMQGWMSPEEIMWDNGSSAGATEPFEVRGGSGSRMATTVSDLFQPAG